MGGAEVENADQKYHGGGKLSCDWDILSASMAIVKRLRDSECRSLWGLRLGVKPSKDLARSKILLCCLLGVLH